MSTSSPVLYNGNYYLVVNSAVTWTEALNAAAAMTYEGRQGHLVTITSAAEQQFVHGLVSSSVTTGWDNRSAWIAATDAASEGVWRWAAGPEAGMQFWNGNSAGLPVSGNYNSWILNQLVDTNSATGMSGSWSNPRGTGADYAWTNAYYESLASWNIGYSNPDAISSVSSPIASSDGVRNAYVVEFSRSTSSITALSSSVAEGNTGSTSYTFTVSLDWATLSAQTLTWAVSGGGADAATASDFVGDTLPTGTVTFGIGETSKTITIEVAGDTSVETDEGFTVTLINASAGLVLGTASATGSIINDDASVSIAATSASKAEGNSASTAYTFTATRTGDTSVAQTANWAVTGAGTNAATAADFVGAVLPSGTVSFGIGETSKTITVNVLGETSVEAGEGFTVTLSTPSAGLLIGTDAANSTIINDDGAKILSGNPYSNTNEVQPNLVMLSNGKLLIIWASNAHDVNGNLNTKIFAKIIDGEGNIVNQEKQIITFNPGDDNCQPQIAGLMDGNFVITWKAGYGEAKFQVFDTQLEPLLTPISLSSLSMMSMREELAVAAAPDGTFMIAGMKFDGDWNVVAQRFSQIGAKLDGEISIGATGSYEYEPEIASGPGGSFAVVWSRFNPFRAETLLQIIDHNGTKIGGEIEVNIQKSGDQQGASVAIAPNGNIIVAWSSTDENPDLCGTYVRVFSSTGAPITSEIRVSEKYYMYGGVDLAVSNDGIVAISYLSNGSVYFKKYNAYGAALSDEVRVDGGILAVEAPSSKSKIAINESNEVVVVWHSARAGALTAEGGGALITDDVAIFYSAGHIIDDNLSSITIAESQINKVEGGAGGVAYSFMVVRTGDTSVAHTANWAVTGSGTSPATASDFVGAVLPSGTVSFGIGETSKTITVYVQGDVAVEADEGFTVTLSAPSTGLVIGTSTASGTIINDDASVSIAAASASKAEGNSGTTAYTFTATRTGDTSTGQTVQWAVTGSGTNAANANDFVGAELPTGTVSFGIGETSKTITVAVAGDTAVENDEGFTVTLSNPSENLTIGAGGGDTQFYLRITVLTDGRDILKVVDNTLQWEHYDFAAPGRHISVGDLGGEQPTKIEISQDGNNWSSPVNWFPVWSQPYPNEIRFEADSSLVAYYGAPGFNLIDLDIVSTSARGTISLVQEPAASNDFEALIEFNDNPPSGPSWYSAVFSVVFSLDASTASGTIINDDASVSIAATSANKAEGNSGSTAYTFTATRTGDTSAAQTANWAVTGSGTNAAIAADFQGGVLPSDTVTFGIGETSKTITVNVLGDTSVENNEGFTVTLSALSTGLVIGTATASGTIINDDASVSIVAASASKAEGNSGATAYTFTATRTGDTSTAQTANWAVTGSGTNAAIAADFVGAVLPIGTVSFGVGVTSQTITVFVQGDTALENDEGFTVTLSTPSTGLVIGTSTAVGTIINDDAQQGTNGNDTLIGTPQADTLEGLGGNDSLVGLASDDRLDGGTGADTMWGGAGNDTYVVDHTGDRITELSRSGSDRVESSISYSLGAELESLLLTGASHINGVGNTFSNQITGNSGNNRIEGGLGEDTLLGGAGADTLLGGAGNDQLTGGSGNDVFRFSSYSDSGDIIRDFVRGEDRIDLSAIDADATLAGDQAFEFQGVGDALYFIPPGGGIFGGFLATRATVSYSYNLYSDRTTVEIDSTDARSVADMTIYLSGRVALQASDFVL